MQKRREEKDFPQHTQLLLECVFLKKCVCVVVVTVVVRTTHYTHIICVLCETACNRILADILLKSRHLQQAT
jgi:hypothetical protein